jgi:hypothetical protein
MGFFNNREIATAIWLIIACIFLLFIGNIVTSLPNLFKAFFKTKILTPLFLMMTYTTGIVFILYQVCLWTTSLLKDTIYWFGSTGIVLASKFITSRNNVSLFKETVVDSLKIVMIIEFIINTYTFSLLGELILVPVVTFIVLINTIAETDKKYSSVKKPTYGLLIIIGIAILGFAISKAVSDYKILGSMETLRSFLLPPLLTLLFLPFLYFLVLCSNYEQLFVRLDLGHKKSKELKRYAKKEIMKHCLFSRHYPK